MANRIPVKAIYTGSDATALGEYISTDKIDSTYLNTGTTANKLVQLDGSAKLPAVDGSNLTNLPSNKYIQVIAVEKATALVDGADIIGTIEIPFAGTLTNLRAKTTTGTCTVTFNKGGTSVGIVNAITTGVNTTVNSAITVYDDMTFDVSSASGTGLTIILTVEL